MITLQDYMQNDKKLLRFHTRGHNLHIAKLNSWKKNKYLSFLLQICVTQNIEKLINIPDNHHPNLIYLCSKIYIDYRYVLAPQYHFLFSMFLKGPIYPSKGKIPQFRQSTLISIDSICNQFFCFYQQFFLATSRTLVGVESSEKEDENNVIECEVLSGVEGIISCLSCCTEEEDVIESSNI